MVALLEDDRRRAFVLDHLERAGPPLARPAETDFESKWRDFHAEDPENRADQTDIGDR
jgi:hypothetical protein